MLLSKKSVNALNKRLRENEATYEIYNMLERRRKEVRREYQSKELVMRDPDDDEYETQKILGQAMDMINGVREKSKDLQDKMNVLDKKWNFKKIKKQK